MRKGAMKIKSHTKTSPFSDREKEMAGALLKGYSNRRIAEQLGICEKTVEKHLTTLYKKIGAKSRLAAVLWLISRSRDFPN